MKGSPENFGSKDQNKKDQKKGSKKVSRNKEAIGHRNYFVKQTKKSPRTKLNTKINKNLFCSDHSGQPRFQ